MSKAAVAVTRIPGIVAYNDLLERILEHGVVLDGESQLAAIGSDGRNHLLATVNPAVLLSSGGGMKGVSQRRKGAPVSGAAIRQKD